MPDLIETERNEIIKLINEFVVAVTNIRLYPHNHSQVLAAIDNFHGSTLQFFDRRPELTLYILNDDIIVLDKPLPNAGLAGELFIKILKEKGIERITFLEGLSKVQLNRFLADLASGYKHVISSDDHIKLGRVVFNGLDEKGEDPGERSADFLSFNKMASDELKKIYREIQDNRKPDAGRAKEIVNDFIKIYNNSINPLKILAPIKSNDEYTYVHITNVALLTICFADYLGFSGKNLEDIGIAALLHDVGKMFIPVTILNKPGPLTAHERAVMETHTLKGAQYISYQKNVPKLTMIAALEHHIKYDGSGYPLIKPNWQPNIAIQMISIADVYDAMRSKRPYQEAMKYDKVIKILQTGRGSTYNPRLIEKFLAMIER